MNKTQAVRLIFVLLFSIFSLITPSTRGVALAAETECVPVSAPSPIQFELNVGRRHTIMATYKWFETSEGVWQLMLDVNPLGGREEWVSSYPRLWALLKPENLPQTVTEVECEEEPELELCPWNSEISSDSELCVEPEPTNPPIGGPSDDKDDDDDKPKPWKTKLATDNHQCTEAEFDAVMDVKEDGVGKGGVKVTFHFNGQTVEVRSNGDGRARTKFARAAGTLVAEAEGYPTQSMVIEDLGCGPAILDPDRGGQVLGASTLADTGTTNWLAMAGIYAGLAMLGGAAYAYRKDKIS